MEHELKLPGDPEGAVMRFAPNPNGPLTIGHARGVVVNNHLARKYGGRFILRFDDTDPKVKKPLAEAYDWIMEDCLWLDARPDEKIIASENIGEYYRHAVELMKLGGAYVCTCERKAFKAMKDQSIECKCRKAGADDNLAGWERMLDGTYGEGEAVLRVKTDIKNPDPALRDWVAFRITHGDHPIVGEKYRVWPMLDFESAIEDHVRGVTHIIRGKDLLDSGRKQEYVYNYFGWTYPEVILWGRIRLEEFGKFSTSQMSADIASGKYEGWDDPALPTLKALRRRGVTPEAITEFMLGLGLSNTDISASMENLYAINRKIIDPDANRYFFVKNPVKMIVKGLPGMTVRLPLHPTFRGRGLREHCLKEDNECFYISKSDVEKMTGDFVKLIGLPCVKVTGTGGDIVEAEFIREKPKKTQKIQCLQDYAECVVRRPDGVDEGYCEPQCRDLDVGTVVQFERYGFCRLEGKEGRLSFVYTHD
ncbi:MAG: glutamate--tRNA ligase [Candidatus Altiarchaeota archaeon]